MTLITVVLSTRRSLLSARAGPGSSRQMSDTRLYQTRGWSHSSHLTPTTRLHCGPDITRQRQKLTASNLTLIFLCLSLNKRRYRLWLQRNALFPEFACVPHEVWQMFTVYWHRVIGDQPRVQASQARSHWVKTGVTNRALRRGLLVTTTG